MCLIMSTHSCTCASVMTCVHSSTCESSTEWANQSADQGWGEADDVAVGGLGKQAVVLQTHAHIPGSLQKDKSKMSANDCENAAARTSPFAVGLMTTAFMRPRPRTVRINGD